MSCSAFPVVQCCSLPYGCVRYRFWWVSPLYQSLESLVIIVIIRPVMSVRSLFSIALSRAQCWAVSLPFGSQQFCLIYVKWMRDERELRSRSIWSMVSSMVWSVLNSSPAANVPISDGPLRAHHRPAYRCHTRTHFTLRSVITDPVVSSFPFVSQQICRQWSAFWSWLYWRWFSVTRNGKHSMIFISSMTLFIQLSDNRLDAICLIEVHSMFGWVRKS